MTLPSPPTPITAQTRSARILVTDAEPRLRDLLYHTFSRAGHSVTTCDRAGQALRLLQSKQQEGYELVVIDLVLQDMDGFELIRRIRQISDIPIMVLSAISRPDDIARALDLGADGYVCKPVHFAELVAKVQALLRRIYHLNRPERHPRAMYGSLQLEQERRMLTIGGRTVRLSNTEHRLFRLLLARANRPVHKQELLRQIWGENSLEPSNVVELAVARLRRKIEEDPAKPRHLITVRSYGYQLCLPTPGAKYEAGEPSRPEHHSLRGPIAAGIPGLVHAPTQ